MDRLHLLLLRKFQSCGILVCCETNKKVFWDYDLEIYLEILHLCKINSTDVEFLLHYYVKIIKEKVWDNLLILENKFGMKFCEMKFHSFGIFVRCKMIKKNFFKIK